MSNCENFDELPEELLDLDFADDSDDEILKEPELLTNRLFEEAIIKADGNKEDTILASFAENVLPKLMSRLVGATAKGGEFTEERKAEGKNVDRSKHDQSFISHLLNGLFPSYRILRMLRSSEMETNPVKRQCGDIETRIFIAAYILHDFDKFPDYPEWLVNDGEGKFEQRNWRKDTPHKSDASDFGRGYIRQKVEDFGLEAFLGKDWEIYLDDIVWLSHNAGEKYDSDRGLEIRGCKPRLDGRVRGVLQNLVRISDLFASIVKNPSDIEKDNLRELLNSLSNNQLKFTYHALSDNRGVLTNIINNALMDVHPQQYYTPLLYLPDGVVYLARNNAPEINTDTLGEEVIKKIKKLCANQLYKRPVGFSRDGKGLKFADFYWLFFSLDELMKISINAACKLLPDSKKASAIKRSESLQKFQNNGELSQDLNVVFENEIRIDRLAEFGDIICRGIWNKWCDRAILFQKKLPKAQRRDLPELNLTHKLAEYLGLSEEIQHISSIDDTAITSLQPSPQAARVPREEAGGVYFMQYGVNALTQIQSLKKTGGVPLDWYYLAAKFFQKNPGKDYAEIVELMEGMVDYAANLVQPILEEFQIPDGWDDLRIYVNQIITLPSGAVVKPKPDSFLVEIQRYQAAKINGRGRENVCALSSSAYTVKEQMESATLFAPQVYSNRQILFNAQAAKRQICSIWSIEIMLRQILMSKTNATGGDFENRKFRYLYLYPTYFFTPETNKFLQLAYNSISQTRFNKDLRQHFISKQQIANFEIDNYQQVDDLLIKPNIEPENDSTFKINYPDDETLTFFFMGIPPGRDATDTESWVMPSWLAFTIPLVMDVKVVASESPVPPFISGADFEKTVVLDGEHQAIRSLIKDDNYRLDSILPRNLQKFSPLNALTAAYCIHLEANRKKDGNPDWGKLTDLARDLETDSLYVFHYLSKWLRKQDKIDIVPIAKIELYFELYKYFEPEEKSVNELRELTRLYRHFYRAKKRYAKANAILKPIDEVADVILKVDKALITKNEQIDKEVLTDIVASRLAKLMNNVRRRTAEGKPTLALVDGKWKPALTPEEERQAVYEYTKYFVEVIFDGKFKCDRARLAGTQLNLIRDTCEYIYRLEDDKEFREYKQEQPEEIPEIDDSQAA